jgi:hypothetical protein
MSRNTVIVIVILTSEDKYLDLRPRPAYTFLVCCLVSLPLWLFLTPHAVMLIVKFRKKK